MRSFYLVMVLLENIVIMVIIDSMLSRKKRLCLRTRTVRWPAAIDRHAWSVKCP
jgi:hypothetical protein